MGNDEALHLAVLMPVWALRMVLMLVTIIMYAVAGALLLANATASYLHYFGLEGYSESSALAILMTMLALTTCTFLIDVVATIMYCCHALSLLLFLVFSIVQSAMFTGVFALTIIGYEHSNLSGILTLTTVPWVLFISLAIYAIVMFWRERRTSASDAESIKYEKTSSEVFPNGKLPSTFSTSDAHPVSSGNRSSQEAYV